MPVSTVHPQYSLYQDIWRTTRDASAGDARVKKHSKIYLATDFMKTEPERFKVYAERAYFMGVTGRTEKAMVGMVFRKPADVTIPDVMVPLVDDIDGSGSSMDQIAKDGLQGLLETRRHLYLVDYPQAQEGLDAEAERNLGLRPTVAQYPCESLINWRFEGIQGQRKLVLAVLVEHVNKSADEFEHDNKLVYRVLRLRDGVYTQQMYDDALSPTTEEYSPRMAGGAPFDHIPLHGVRELEEPPLFSIAKVNLAHYRNIADLEDSAYTVGQPMLHVNIGETSEAEWTEQNAGGIKFGSRNGIITRKGSIELVQAAENNLIRQAKLDKENEMIMLGAQLITRGGQAETAEAARINASAESSVLDTLVNDLSEDLEACLEDMARFIGVDPDGILYKLNTDYWDTGLDPSALMAVIQGYSSNIYAQKDALHMIRTGRIQIEDGRTYEDIQGEVASQVFDSDPLSGTIG